MILVASRAKRPVELFVGTDPNPQPKVAFESAGDSAVISRYANRPETGVPAQTLQMQTWMRRIIGKFFVSKTGRTLGFWPQRVVTPPELVGATRPHSYLSKFSSFSSGNCSGLARNAASTSSPSLLSAGRGRGSRMIRSHSASPSSSGRSVGIKSANFDRSAGARLRMASSISSTVLTFYRYNTGCSPATCNAPPPQETRPTSLPFEGACNMTGQQHRCRPGLPTRRGMRVPLAR